MKGILDLSARVTRDERGVQTSEGDQEVHMNEDAHPVHIRGILEAKSEIIIVHLVMMIIGVDHRGFIVRNHVEGVIAEVPCAV